MGGKIFFAVVVILLVGVGAYFFLINRKTTPSPTSNGVNITAGPNQTIITYTSSGFNPSTTTVTKGTKIVWINRSGQEASINSDDHPTHTKFPDLNLGEYADGSSQQVVLENKGTYTYHNHLNPSHRGTIIVQ